MPRSKTDPLPSWNEGPAKQSVLDFIARVTTDGGSEFVSEVERIAVFDNDGTLWCEKPMPIELGFILERLATQANQDLSLRERQPWKAAFNKDYAWLGESITKHYHGDNSDVKLLMGGVIEAFAGMTVEAYQTAAAAFLHQTQHPTFKLDFVDCVYPPMIELLRYLESCGFTTFVASAGDRDFMRTVAQEIYGIPPDRVIGSSTALRYQQGKDGCSVVYQAEPDVLDDGLVKPVRIWSRIGRRPIFAAGNSNGDIPMMRFCARPSRPSFGLLINHDDEKREYAYQAGAEELLSTARKQGWAVVSMK